MADKTYRPLAGIVQKFGDKDAVSEREYNDEIVRDFTIKLFGKDTLVRVSVFASIEADWDQIVRGTAVFVDGELKVDQKDDKTYFSITANSLAAVPPFGRKARAVSNAGAPATSSDDSLDQLLG